MPTYKNDAHVREPQHKNAGAIQSEFLNFEDEFSVLFVPG